ncbi:MAG: SDR family oxidoreductase [Alphaproteobacteria bacterium]|nr:SDR family oxidoreductase [Alphaproteobacteria bacterium]
MLLPHCIFITGATSGFGEACARRAVREGAKVVIAGRRQERLHALEQELGDAALAVRLDVRDPEAVRRAFDALPSPFDAIDALVNNAGLALNLAPLQDVPPEELETMVDTNIKGMIYCTRAALPGMIARNRGHIVNIGSTAGSYPYPGAHVYGGTKAFVKQFSLNLRADLLGKRIRVTAVEPGMAETEFSLTRFHGDRAQAAAVYDGLTPLSPSDVAETIWWVLTRPPHVNVNRIELMPVMQAFSALAVHREPA